MIPKESDLWIICAQVAVACIKIASQAVATMPMLLFWPLVPFLALCCLVIYWLAVAAFLYSAGDIKPTQLAASTTGALSLAVSITSGLHLHHFCVNLPWQRDRQYRSILSRNAKIYAP